MQIRVNSASGTNCCNTRGTRFSDELVQCFGTSYTGQTNSLERTKRRINSSSRIYNQSSYSSVEARDINVNTSHSNVKNMEAKLGQNDSPRDKADCALISLNPIANLSRSCSSLSNIDKSDKKCNCCSHYYDKDGEYTSSCNWEQSYPQILTNRCSNCHRHDNYSTCDDDAWCSTHSARNVYSATMNYASSAAASDCLCNSASRPNKPSDGKWACLKLRSQGNFDRTVELKPCDNVTQGHRHANVIAYSATDNEKLRRRHHRYDASTTQGCTPVYDHNSRSSDGASSDSSVSLYVTGHVNDCFKKPKNMMRTISNCSLNSTPGIIRKVRNLSYGKQNELNSDHDRMKNKTVTNLNLPLATSSPSLTSRSISQNNLDRESRLPDGCRQVADVVCSERRNLNTRLSPTCALRHEERFRDNSRREYGISASKSVDRSPTSQRVLSSNDCIVASMKCSETMLAESSCRHCAESFICLPSTAKNI